MSTDNIDIHAILRAREARQAAELLAQVLGAGPQLDSVTEEREYALGADVVYRSSAPLDEGRVVGVVTRIRAECVTWHDENGEPQVQYTARGYRTPYTKAGKPSKAEKPSWSWMPSEIAEALFTNPELNLDIDC